MNRNTSARVQSWVLDNSRAWGFCTKTKSDFQCRKHSVSTQPASESPAHPDPMIHRQPGLVGAQHSAGSGVEGDEFHPQPPHPTGYIQPLWAQGPSLPHLSSTVPGKVWYIRTPPPSQESVYCLRGARWARFTGDGARGMGAR